MYSKNYKKNQKNFKKKFKKKLKFHFTNPIIFMNGKGFNQVLTVPLQKSVDVAL